MSKRHFLLPLLLLAASGALACYDPAGSGQCGPSGIGPRNPGGYGSGGYVPSYTSLVYVPPPVYAPPPTYTPPPIRESRYGAVAYYENPNGKWNSRTMFASVHNISSKQRARQMALQACNRKSGRTCQVFDYADQCVSVTTGFNSDAQKLFSALSVQRGQAPLDATQQCITQSEDCKFVVQEECSLPKY